MASRICQVFGGYVVVAAEAEDSGLEGTMRRMRLLLEHAANVADKAHKVHLLRRRLVGANAPVEPVWFRLFLPTEFLSQRLEMPVKGFKKTCRSSPGRRIC